jgi:hypothetical protein
MIEEILKSENLIEIHEKLNSFAQHHQRVGFKKAQDILGEFLHERAEQVRDGSSHGKIFDKGYDNAIEDILRLFATK